MSSEKVEKETGVPSGNGGAGRKRRWIVAGIVVCGALAAGIWWLTVRFQVSTDDAYVVADVATVSSRVPGSIQQLFVENDDPVRKGDVLLKLDPAEYRLQVESAEAALQGIEAEIRIAESTLTLADAQTRAQLQSAEAQVRAAREGERLARHKVEELERLRDAARAEYKQAKRDFERYARLFQEGSGSEQQRDRARTAFRKARARLEALKAQIAGAKASLEAAVQRKERAEAQRDAARADRLRVEIQSQKIAALRARRAGIVAQKKTAELRLSYCTIYAPLSGYIAQKRIQVGDRVQPGQPLLAVVPLQHAYVEANFKETQIEDIRIGQAAEIKADLYSGRVYKGRVAGIRAGTGAAFSLLPPENATGNWIKVVQRIPVRIVFSAPLPEDYPLRIGASLRVTVFTRDQSGPRLIPEKHVRQ